MSRRTLLRVAVLAGSLFLTAGLTPQSSTLMSAEPATDDPFAVPAKPATDDPFAAPAKPARDDPFAAPTPKPATDDPFAAPIESASLPIGLPTSPAELKILKALDEPTELDFIEEPLQGVVDYLSDRHKIQIVFDIRALEDLNIGTDEPMTHKLSGISLRSALDLVLRDLDLAWTIDREVLLITTVDVADESCLVKVYDVGDLVVCQDEDGRLWDDYDSLIDTITFTVAPHTWAETTGGPGSFEGHTFASAKVLVIRQTRQVHLEIAQLLDTIRAVVKAHGTDAKPPVRKQPPPKPARPFAMGASTIGMPADAAEKPPK